MEKKEKKRISLTMQIFIGLVFGAALGHWFPDLSVALKPLGDMFIRMIKMIVVPLIFTSLIVGIAGTGDFKKLGRLGVKSLIWFEFATTIALIIGLLVVNLIQPGVGVSFVNSDVSSAMTAAKKSVDMVQLLVNLVPTNIVDALARGDMLQIIFFSCFFGVAAAALQTTGEPVVNLARSVVEIMFKVTHYIMELAPVGVFALIAYTVGKYGLGMLVPLAKLIGTLYFGVAVFLVFIFIVAALLVRVNFLHLIRALKEPALLAFSTSSSEAALPLAMERLERFGVPKHIVTFVMPTGYSFNLDGSTLYSSLAVVFIAQMYNIDFPISSQIIMVLTLMLSTKGIAGVPGASMIVVASTAAAFGFPVEGVAIVMGIDRIMDMARSMCNVFGNCLATVVVARWEKEMPDEKLQEAYLINYED